ncbi:tRNA1(Val) (adenine(37)-N6)-methyltransferase [soil metagenome]
MTEGRDNSRGEITEDRVLGGRIVLSQPRVGYRAGLDAALLAASVQASAGERVLEAGCGVGAALLAAAVRSPGVSFVGVERDEAARVLAAANVAANSLGDRAVAVAGDIALPFRNLGLTPFDVVMSNPPFFDDPGALRGPNPARRGAYLADDGLAAWTGFLLKAAREGGRIHIIHRADRLADILAGLAPKAGSFRIRPIQPFADAPAKRVLVQAVKTGKAPLVLLPALVLHERGGEKHRPDVEAILHGEAFLGWD